MRFQTLQIGRLVAALIVLLLHVLHYGQTDLGLDLPPNTPFLSYVLNGGVVYFFVLSGFVVTLSAQRSTLQRLCLVRLLRFYPTYWTAAGLVLLVRWLGDASFPVRAKVILKGLTLWPFGEGRAVYPLGIEWTLIYEIWLLFGMIPLLLIGRRWGVGIGSAVWLAAIVAKELTDPLTAYPVLPTLKQWPLAIFNAPFLMGVLVYLTYHRWAKPRLWLPLLSMIPLYFGSQCFTTAPGSSYLLQSLGVALFTAWLAVIRQPRDRNPLVRAGDWTYGIYLLHASVLMAFYSWALKWANLSPSVTLLILGAALAFLVGAVYGWAEYRVFLQVRRLLP